MITIIVGLAAFFGGCTVATLIIFWVSLREDARIEELNNMYRLHRDKK